MMEIEGFFSTAVVLFSLLTVIAAGFILTAAIWYALFRAAYWLYTRIKRRVLPRDSFSGV